MFAFRKGWSWSWLLENDWRDWGQFISAWIVI
jgi:hypothetical protein